MAKKIKLETLNDVRGELEHLYNEEDADPEGSNHTKLRILAQAKDVLQQTALEQKLDALEELVRARLASVTPFRKIG